MAGLCFTGLQVAGAQDNESGPAVPEPGEVLIETTDSRVLYRYLDDNGIVVVQDRPPAWYQIPVNEVETTWVVVDDTQALSQSERLQRLRTELQARIRPHLSWILALVLGTVGVRLLRKPAPPRPEFDEDIGGVLRHAGFDFIDEVVLPIPGGGVAKIDQIARTPAGLLVLEQAHGEGQIQSAPDEPMWREEGDGRQREFHNPVARVDRRIDLIRGLTGGIPVHGRVVFAGGGSFPAGVPVGVVTPRGLRKLLPKFRHGKVSQAALDDAWRALQQKAGRDPLPSGVQAFALDKRRMLGVVMLLAAVLSFLLV